MTGLPLLVIGGYLGAGKTTLIRHLLRNNGGRRLLVLVNDFGAINIDADLIAESAGDTIALSNGCVCCSMSGDLYYAIGDALDRIPQPDLIVIEASGVSEPARIATVARAEPMLNYSGVITVVDAEAIVSLLEDKLIGPQVARQVAQADLLVLSKTDLAAPEAAYAALRRISAAPYIEAVQGKVDAGILLGIEPSDAKGTAGADHRTMYDTWSGTAEGTLSQERVEGFLAELPRSLFRLKGWFTTAQGTTEIHRVGLRLDKSHGQDRAGSSVIAISPKGTLNSEKLRQEWVKLTR